MIPVNYSCTSAAEFPQITFVCLFELRFNGTVNNISVMSIRVSE